MASDTKSLLIHGAHIVDSAHDGAMDIRVQSGVITAVERGLSSDGAAAVEAGGLTCLPAFCDLHAHFRDCLLYTSDAADDLLCVDLGGRRIIKKKKTLKTRK